MALVLADRLIIERWSGPVLASEEEELDGVVGVMGSPYGAALHRLMARLAQMTTEAASSSAGDDRSDHAANLKPLGEMVDRLAGFMRSSADLTLSEAEELLLAQAAGSPSSVTSVFDMPVSYPRRG